ncbi:hypothetical protein [Paenibacillus psychroresistens]|nr:hypothetical protein [Paenibacillus psychroresistens]
MKNNKNDSMEQKNQSMKNKSDDAQKSKANIIDPTDKKLHAPNRPSI